MKIIMIFGLLALFLAGCSGIDKQALIEECIPCCEDNPEFGSCEWLCESHINDDYPPWARSHQDFVDIMCKRSTALQE